MKISFKNLDKILPFVGKPGRYVGGEINVVEKDIRDVSLRMVISYPDIYEVGMSNTAIQILYNVINKIDRYYCERVFAPWKDLEYYLRKDNIPLFSLETYTPLVDFDIVGFSIGYELLYTNLLNIIDLGKIPVFSKKRDEEDPIIIAGGPGIYNPEPIADFIDVFIFGDGERALVEFLRKYEEVKELSRIERLKVLDKFDFTYIPILYETERIGNFLYTKINKKVKRRIEPDIENLPIPQKPIVPIIKTVQDRVTVEVTRGCTTGCRFCQAGFIYRPVRERSIERIKEAVIESLKNTGYDEVSLSSLSISDYTDLFRLVYELNAELIDNNVSISLPSLKVNSTNVKILEMIQRVRKSGLTFAIESPDEEVRKKINKAVDDNQLISIIKEVSSLGWRLIKLYFMIGLPFSEREGEKIEEFIKMLLEVEKRLNINVNVSLFVPKPHTPFERVRQLNLEEAKSTLNYLRSVFRKGRVKIKYQNPEMSMIECVMSRGDRTVSSLIYEVFKSGERFSSWDEIFNFNLWIERADTLGINLNNYTEEFNKYVKLPWDFIDTGVNRNFLDREYRNSESSKITENCIYDGCPGCGVCKGNIKNILERERKGVKEVKIDHFKSFKKEKKSERSAKYLIKFKKLGKYAYFSHLDLVNFFSRVAKRSGLPLKYTQGFNPKPKIVIPFPLPLGVESDFEIMELFLEDNVDGFYFRELLNSYLPKDISVTDVLYSKQSKSIASKPYCHDYFIKADDVELTLINLNRDIVKKADLTKDDVLVGYNIVKNGLFIRLFGNMSIKKVFDVDKAPEILSRTKRIKIWEVVDEKISDFI